MGQGVEGNIELGKQVDKGIDPAFRLEELIDDNHFFFLQDAVAALEGASFIPDHIAGFFNDLFDLL